MKSSECVSPPPSVQKASVLQLKPFVFNNIPKQLEKLVFGVVGQPQNLSPPASLNFLSLAASASASPGQIWGASLPNSQLFKSFVYTTRNSHRKIPLRKAQLRSIYATELDETAVKTI